MRFKHSHPQFQLSKQGAISFLLTILLCVAYIALTKINLHFLEITQFAILIWPPTGVALAAIYFWGYRLWPGLFLGAIIVNLLLKSDIFIAIGLALGNTVEACLGVYLLRLSKFDPSLGSARVVFNFIILACILSTLGAGLIGTTTLWVGGKIHEIPELKGTFAAWWLGDVMGDLIVAPFLFVWGSAILQRSILRSPILLGRIIETTLLVVTTLWLCKAVFGEVLVLLPFRFNHPYFIFPLSLWASLRFGQMGTTVVNVYVAYMALWGTSDGLGPFSTITVRESFAMVQVFLSILVLTSLFLASTVIEKTRAREELEEKVKERTASLLKSKYLAEDASRKRDELLGVVSHDLKNPLTGILMGINLLRQMQWVQKQGQRQLYLIELAAQSMNRLIKSLLDIYTIEAGGYRTKIQQEHQELDVLFLVTNAVDLQHTFARDKKISITINVPDNLPKITVNSELIAQVFQNLLGNAIKFSSEGGHIWVSAELKSDTIIFSIKDTGPGIEANLIPTLFDRFSQAKRTAGLGTGLGLVIAKGLVEAHNGKIWVESQVGIGSTFFFSIPVGRPTVQPVGKPEGRPESKEV